MPNQNYILILGDKNYVSIYDTKQFKLIHNKYIELEEAERRLADLIDEAAYGEDVVITRSDGASFKIVPIKQNPTTSGVSKRSGAGRDIRRVRGAAGGFRGLHAMRFPPDRHTFLCLIGCDSRLSVHARQLIEPLGNSTTYGGPNTCAVSRKDTKPAKVSSCCCLPLRLRVFACGPIAKPSLAPANEHLLSLASLQGLRTPIGRCPCLDWAIVGQDTALYLLL